MLFDLMSCAFRVVEGEEECNIITSVQDITDGFLSKVADLVRGLLMAIHSKWATHSAVSSGL